jgi:hypothetical protein
MGKTKFKKNNFPYYPQHQKEKKLIPSQMHHNLSYWLMKLLFSKTIGHHIELGLMPLLKNVVTY